MNKTISASDPITSNNNNIVRRMKSRLQRHIGHEPFKKKPTTIVTLQNIGQKYKI